MSKTKQLMVDDHNQDKFLDDQYRVVQASNLMSTIVADYKLTIKTNKP
jgi:hypothetical protein